VFREYATTVTSNDFVPKLSISVNFVERERERGRGRRREGQRQRQREGERGRGIEIVPGVRVKEGERVIQDLKQYPEP